MATKDIRDAWLKLAELEAQLVAPWKDGSDLKIEKVWLWYPSGRTEITDTPCFLNEWVAGPVAFGSALTRRSYTFRTRLLIYDADLDVAAEMASAFETPMLEMLARNVTLEQTVTNISEWRGADPTIGPVEYGAKRYIGCDHELDVELVDAIEIGP
jgi:hypothetical protein